jgi:hypothetical protein
MKMGFFEENGNWIRDDYKYGCFSAADPVNTWKKNFIQANAPANAATVKADIYIVTPGGTVNGGPIYVDDVTLRMKSPEMTAIKASNGGFETANVYDANAKDWTFNRGGTIERVNETAHSGNWSAKMSARAPLPGENDIWLVLSQNQYMGYDFGGKPWEFTAWLKSLSSSPITVFQDVLVKVNYIDAKGQDITPYVSRTVFTAGDALDSWKPVSVTGVAPAGAIAARFEVLVKGPSDGGNSGTLYVDDVNFVTTKSLIFGDFNKDTDIDFDDLAKIVDNWLKLL